MIFQGNIDAWFYRHLTLKWHRFSFADPTFEAQYQAERRQTLLSSVLLYRFITVICTATIMLDYFAFSPEYRTTALIIRLALLIIPNVIISIFFFKPIIQQHLDDVYLVAGIFAVTCVNLLQFIAPVHDVAFHYYVFGHFITIVAFYGMTFLPITIAHTIAALGMAEYIAVHFLHAQALPNDILALFSQNESFLTALALYSMFWITSIAMGVALRIEVRKSLYHRVLAEQKHQEIEIQRIELQAQNDEIMRHKALLEEQAEMIADVNHELKLKHILVEEEQEKSEKLLSNILPASIAKRLRDGEKIIVDHVDFATVLFADIVGFTKLASSVTPETLLVILNSIYSAFDDIVEQYQVEKIKTIGDSYMVVGGLLEYSPDHVERMCEAAHEFIRAVDRINEALDLSLCVRVGIHCGEVVAGVIGTKKVAYDLWGDTVNIASRMESHGASGKIHISEAVHAVIGAHKPCIPNGVVDVKGIGNMRTWYLAA